MQKCQLDNFHMVSTLEGPNQVKQNKDSCALTLFVESLKLKETQRCLAKCQKTLTLFALNIVNRKCLQWALSLTVSLTVRSVK